MILPWSFKIKIRIKIKSLPPSAFGTFPRFAGEGKAVVAAGPETRAVASPAKRGKLPRRG